jgi:DHA1 family bicyclomycin/chloramphenicol resistance-like MFS transporter
MILAGRVVAGIGGAGPRIIAMAVVRDLHAGRRMARIMSFVSATFILVPIIAPSAGQAILLVSSWRGIFAVLSVMTIIVGTWFSVRQPETLPAERRRPLSLGPVGAAILEVLRTRQTLRYIIAAGLVFAALIAYLATAPQIFGDVYSMGKAFPLCFAALAASLGAASFLNGRLVMRFGMVRLSGLALRVSVVTSTGFLIWVVIQHGHPPLWAFMAYMVIVFFCNGLLFGNFNALAMDPLGHIAGAAAAVIGSATSLVSTVVGTPIGRLYDGTVTPLVCGFFLMTLGALLVTTVGAPKIDDSDRSTGTVAH